MRPSGPRNPSPLSFSTILRPTAIATVEPEKVPDSRPGSGDSSLRWSIALPCKIFPTVMMSK